jgi:hypothetical protein
MWVHPLGIYNISSTNLLIRCKLCEGHFKKAIHQKKKKSCEWQTAQAVDGRYVIGSHIRNVVSFF